MIPNQAHYNAAMPTAAIATLPASALLGRLLLLRVLMLLGWAVGIIWLHWGMSIRMPLLPMAAVLGLMGLFALATAWRIRKGGEAGTQELLAHLLTDLTAFAVLVFYSGGATNPFVSLMLVPVVIAAVSMPPVHAWVLAGIAGGFYALLLFNYLPLAIADPVAAYGMHLGGMWVNFLISAALIAYFITRLQASLRERDAALAELREKQLRDERIMALGTQAALAAHELATPLSTIATTAHELAREFANDPDIGEDCRMLEKQAASCKRILDQLAGRAQAGEPVAMPLGQWLEHLLSRWQVVRPEARVSLDLSAEAAALDPVLPESLEQALMNLLNNAADVSPDDVNVHAGTKDDALVFDICDRGPGFSPEQQRQAGRTAFRGKPGQGMGVGLALTHATVERLGGTVNLIEREGGGTRVRVRLPLAPEGKNNG
jgi:two-component system, sensor histidine kinase RegB